MSFKASEQPSLEPILPDKIYERSHDEYQAETNELKQFMLKTKEQMLDEEAYGNNILSDLENTYSNIARNLYFYSQLARVTSQLYKIDDVSEGIESFIGSFQNLDQIYEQEAQDSPFLKEMTSLHKKLNEKPAQLREKALDEEESSSEDRRRRRKDRSDEAKCREAMVLHDYTILNVKNTAFCGQLDVAKTLHKSLISIYSKDMDRRSSQAELILQGIHGEVRAIQGQISEQHHLASLSQGQSQNVDRTVAFLQKYLIKLAECRGEQDQQQEVPKQQQSGVSLPEELKIVFQTDKLPEFVEPEIKLNAESGCEAAATMVNEIIVRLSGLRELTGKFYRNFVGQQLKGLNPEFLRVKNEQLRKLQSHVEYFQKLAQLLKNAVGGDVDAAIEAIDYCQEVPQLTAQIEREECQHPAVFSLLIKLARNEEVIVPEAVVQKFRQLDLAPLVKGALAFKEGDAQFEMRRDSLVQAIRGQEVLRYNRETAAHPHFLTLRSCEKRVRRMVEQIRSKLEAEAEGPRNRLSVDRLLALPAGGFWLTQRSYICPVCLSDVVDWIFPCGHLVCAKCCERILEKRSQGRKCVICNEPLSNQNQGYKITKTGLE